MSITDIKLYTMNFTAIAVSMSNIDVILKIILLAVSIGYTLHKWYLMYGKNK
tara:strand:+ start:611 stop:766 length:156 start_codon:yes stop_codon:yes gene_type:complete